MNKKILVKFELDCGRCGEIDSFFVSTQEEIDSFIGATFHFNEIVGKHSFVEHVATYSDFNIVSKDEEKVEWLISILGSHLSGVYLKEHII